MVQGVGSRDTGENRGESAVTDLSRTPELPSRGESSFPADRVPSILEPFTSSLGESAPRSRDR
jgi:hypothetical protein